MSRRSGVYTRVDLSSPLHQSIVPESIHQAPPKATASIHYVQRSKRLLVFVSIAVLISVVALWNSSGVQDHVKRPLHEQLDLKKWTKNKASGHRGGFSSVFGGNHKIQKRITLIAMWDDDYPATYLPSFFRSAARNSDAVDLLWINVKRQADQCLDISPYTGGASNIKSVCISDKEDKRMIREYLCQAWQCTEDQAGAVDKHMQTRQDPIHCEFKPLRGGIYKQWIRTKWWAWVDADQLIGNFKDIWPWHAIDNFDVATISEWDVGNLYLRGQFTAFKTDNPKTDFIWMKYSPLSSPEALPTLGHGPLDEFDYSIFYSNTLKDDIDWILIPRILGADKFGANKVVSNGRRHFYVPADMRRRDVTMLLDERFAPKAEPGFAAVNAFDPEQWAVPARELRPGDYVYKKPLWEWCAQPETRCTVLRESYWYSSTLMRYKGQMLEYFDQRSRPRAQKREIFFGIEEKLFIHFQEIKRREWFALPPHGIDEDDILEMRDESIVMWDKHSLETKFTAIRPGAKDATTLADDLLAHSYWGINGTDEMRLPAGVKNALLDGHH